MKMASLAMVLAAIAAAVFLGAPAAVAGETRITMDGSTTVGPIAKAFAGYYMSTHPDVNIVVSESGSGNGAKSIINGTCDIANMSRPMKDDEFKAAVTEKNVYPCAHVIAMDGVCMIVHPSNPVKALTIEQVRDIYTGKITSWKELGGPDVKIVRVSRETTSGTYETFEGLVMNKEKMSGETETVGSNAAVRERVRTTPAAIGYVGLGFLDETVKGLTINGIAPTRETIATGIYPIARPLFMYTNGYPKLGSHVFNIVTIYLTPKGQEMILDKGFVPVTKY